MPRQVGQIDQRKSENILDAAAGAFADMGLEAPMEEIARRARVSKQTIYNHYGCKDDLLRALFERRRATLTEPLDESHQDEPLEDRIAAYVRGLLEAYLGPGYVSIMRSAIVATVTRPDVGRMVHEHGPRLGRQGTADFLARETAAGRLAIDDVEEAAEFLVGMAAGDTIMRVLLGAPVERSPERIEARARACARRFIRAYAPA